MTVEAHTPRFTPEFLTQHGASHSRHILWDVPREILGSREDCRLTRGRPLMMLRLHAVDYCGEEVSQLFRQG